MRINAQNLDIIYKKRKKKLLIMEKIKFHIDEFMYM